MLIETTSGFKWEIDDDARDDQELLDAFIACDRNPAFYSEPLRILLGDDGKKALYEHARGENGRVKASLIIREMREIVEQFKQGPAKNS